MPFYFLLIRFICCLVFDEFYFRGTICDEKFELTHNAKYTCYGNPTCDVTFGYELAYPNVTLEVRKDVQMTPDAIKYVPYRDYDLSTGDYLDERGGLYNDSFTYSM